MTTRRRSAIAALMLAAGTASIANAQDSVASTPGGNDAIAATDTSLQRVRYVLDLAPRISSWGNEFVVGPISKSSRDVNPLFQNQVIASTVTSPFSAPAAFGSPRSFSLWTAAGAGVNPGANAAPGSSVSVSSFDRQFGVALSDLSSTATNVVSLAVGQNANDLSRLYVERTIAAISRLGADDVSSLSAGGVSANGDVFLRADDFNTTSAVAVDGENIVRVNASARNAAAANIIASNGGNTFGTDLGSTSVLVNSGVVTLNTPTALENSDNPAAAGIFDFAGLFSVNGASGVSSHTDPAVDSLRGNPFFRAFGDAAINPNDLVVSLAIPAGGSLAQSINVTEFDVASGAVTGTRSYTMPAPIGAAGFAANTAGNAEFDQYLSQVSFRGPNGLAAVADLGSSELFAATANDPTAGQFIALVEDDGSPAWTVVAWQGKPVLDGLNGTQIGTIATASPVSISAPAIDSLGNVYFVAAYQPTTGPAAAGFFKAHPVGGGNYQLELVLRTGVEITGANSNQTYTITDITLADSDSLASGGFHAGSLTPGAAPGVSNPDPKSPKAFGGALVNATIEYNRSGIAEAYNVTLFVGADGATSACAGDADGDGAVDGADLLAVINNFGASGPGLSAGQGDVIDDDVVDGADLLAVINNFGCQ